MNATKRLEILEAFASSKAYEFNGFVQRYLEAHPEEPSVTVVVEPLIVEAPAPPVVVKTVKKKPVEAPFDESTSEQSTA